VTELLQKLLDSVKGLSLSNVLVLALLALIAVPAYVGWKVINNPALMSIVFSDFEEIPSVTDCNLFRAQSSGSAAFWAVTNQFGQRNAESWSIAVRVKFLPDAAAMRDYCASLEAVVSYLRDPTSDLPTFPGSNKVIFVRTAHPAKDK
jgi:hypothetical protein